MTAGPPVDHSCQVHSPPLPSPSHIHRLDRHKKMLQQNFSRIGPKRDEDSEETEESPLVKESDCVHSLWATGRHNCDGLLVLVKVQWARHMSKSVLVALVVLRAGAESEKLGLARQTSAGCERVHCFVCPYSECMSALFPPSYLCQCIRLYTHISCSLCCSTE